MNSDNPPNSKHAQKVGKQLPESLHALAGTGKGLWTKNAIDILRNEWKRT